MSMAGSIEDLEKVLKIEVSEDRLEARLFSIGSTEGLTREDCRTLLVAYGLSEGIQLSQLDSIGSLGIGQSLLCAKGKSPIPTQQPKIDYFFPVDTHGHLATEGDGSVNFREIGKFNNSEEGKVLAVLTPGVLGISGVDVYGREIGVEPLQQKKIVVGKLVELTPDGMRAIAKVSGHACRIDGKITILPKIQIPGDVDYSVGNIHFIGDVDIAGNILSGFTVEVEGNLMVAKNIENANVKVGKDLFVNGNVFGRGGCKIEVGGKATFNEIDSATVDVLGELVVRNGIRHSSIRCGGSIEITSNNGVIVGGDVSALRKIKTGNLGNSMGTVTRASVGFNPFVHQQLANVGKAIEELNAKLTQIQNHHSVLERKMVGSNPQESMIELSNKLKAAEAAVMLEIKDKEAIGEELKAKVMDLGKASIEVSGTLYSSVIIFIRRGKIRTFNEQKMVRAEEVAGEVKFTSLYARS
jgi:uncharacterized protein